MSFLRKLIGGKIFAKILPAPVGAGACGRAPVRAIGRGKEVEPQPRRPHIGHEDPSRNRCP